MKSFSGIVKLTLLAVFTSFFVLAGCGEGGNDNINGSVQGNSPSDTNNASASPDEPVTDEAKEPTEDNGEALWEKTEYNAPSGKWFMHNGEGILGYGLTTGSKQAGEEFSVSLFGHGDDGELIDRDFRIQLTERDNEFEKTEVIFDERLHVDAVTGNETIYTAFLPEKENVTYLLSVEVIGEEDEVEDTMVSVIKVPAQEINATLSTDQEVYDLGSGEIALIVNNEGPTDLFFGKYYTIEKQEEGTWKEITLQTAFEDIGIILPVGESYQQTINISQLEQGTYRISKKVQADGIDVSEEITGEFTVE